MTKKQEFFLDKRVADRYVERGLLDAKALADATKNLVDVSANVAFTSYAEDEVERDDASDDSE